MKKSAKYEVIAILIVLGLIVVPTAFYQWGTHSSLETQKIKKMEATHNNESSKYLVFLENGEVIENTDSLFNAKFNSSDVYARLDEGKCYDFDVYGWRVQFLSMYPNVLDYEEVKCSE